MITSSSNSTQFLRLAQQLVILLIIIIQAPKSCSTTQKNEIPKTPFTKIYAFGDSYTDTGNGISKIGQASNMPYGITYFHHPTNRYSDGRLIIDFVTQSLSLPFLPPYKSTITNNAGAAAGVNFAVAGATAIEYGFFVKNNLSFDMTPVSIGTELGWFNNLLDKLGCGNNNIGINKCDELFEDTLFWVGEIGGNDYGYSSVGTSVDKKLVQGLAITRVSTFLEAILKKGAKYVVIQGLPPTGCLTLSMLLAPTDDRDDIGCVGTQNRLSSSHNMLLQGEIEGLRKKYPDSFLVYADYYNAYREIMKNRPKYGFEEAFKVCCGGGGGDYNLFSGCGAKGATPCSNPSEYINWDGVHLTEGMYKVVSELFLQRGYCQPSFQELINRKMSQGR